MDFVAWFGRLVFFFFALWLALENTAGVPLRLTSTLQWHDVPLVVVILACFVAGVLAGTFALLPRLIRLQRLAARPPVPTRPETLGQQAAETALTRAARQAGAAGDLEYDTRSRR